MPRMDLPGMSVRLTVDSMRREIVNHLTSEHSDLIAMVDEVCSSKALQKEIEQEIKDSIKQVVKERVRDKVYWAVSNNPKIAQFVEKEILKNESQVKKIAHQYMREKGIEIVDE